jgi:hypothetical protein
LLLRVRLKRRVEPRKGRAAVERRQEAGRGTRSPAQAARRKAAAAEVKVNKEGNQVVERKRRVARYRLVLLKGAAGSGWYVRLMGGSVG